MKLLARLLLIRPELVARRLEQLRAADLVERTPSLWQIQLGVLRMWHRSLFRSETIGTCTAFPVRSTWRARLLRFRPLRAPFLLWERAIAPWDMSGLLSGRERIIRHLLGAHHDNTQFVYDLQMLQIHEGALDELQERLQAIVDGSDPRADWLRDLCVYERYHESLAQGLRRFRAGQIELVDSDAQDPDISFLAYLRWCARQPGSLPETWRAWRRGRFDLDRGLHLEGA